MKTLDEIESTCGQVLAVLERDDLHGSTLATLAATVRGLQPDIDRHLGEQRAAGGDPSDVHLAEDALRTMNADMLWLKEYLDVKPLMVGAQKLRMASLRAMRIVTLLQPAPHAAENGASPARSSRIQPRATAAAGG